VVVGPVTGEAAIASRRRVYFMAIVAIQSEWDTTPEEAHQRGILVLLRHPGIEPGRWIAFCRKPYL
jgi:hypothetical protein